LYIADGVKGIYKMEIYSNLDVSMPELMPIGEIKNKNITSIYVLASGAGRIMSSLLILSIGFINI
jgi:hypothetical protein